MAELSLDWALDAQNVARAVLSPDAAIINICGDNEFVAVEWWEEASHGALSDYLASVESAAEVVSNVIGEGSTLFLTEDHRGRWVLIPND